MTKQPGEEPVGIARLLITLAPGLFVLLWSTGFIGAKLGLPYAEPFTFLAVRVMLVLPIMGLLVLFLAKNKRAAPGEAGHSMVSGVLVHCCYLGGVFLAIDRGMPAGISALIVSLQPMVTAILASTILKEKLSFKTFAWFLVGILGVLLVLSPKLPAIVGQAGFLALSDNAASLQASAGLTFINVFAIIVATVGISLGAVYQKRFVRESGLLVSTLWQYVGAAIGFATLSVLFETRRIVWSGEFVFALCWLVLVLSVGAVLLLMYLVRRDSAQKTASLFYLVPAVVAIIAWAMFDETLQIIQIAGMCVIMLAVYQAMRSR